MVFHQHAEEDLTWPLLKSTGSQYSASARMESREKSMEKTSFTFVVKNYVSLCKGKGVDEMIESEQFMVGGHSWTIAFYPNGKNEHAHNHGHVSLFLCHKNSSGVEEVVDFVCSFTVLDQSSTHLDCRVDEREMYRHFDTLQSGQKWGFPMFVKRETIESRSFGYLRKDRIKIRADLRVFVDQKLPLPPVHDRFVFFKVGDKQLYAEESVLAKRCPNLLRDAILDFECNVFEAMLWFIFKGKLHWQDREAISDSRSDDPNSFGLKMLEAADRFNLKRLKRKCLSLTLYDNPEALVLYDDTVVSSFKNPWRMARRLMSNKLKMIK